jgi:predicted transcriptional regulator
MTDSDLVTRAEKGYGLTNLGKLQAYLLDEMIDFVLALEGHRDFWLTHDISGIPEELLGRIGMLSQSGIIEADPSELLKTVEYFISELKNSRRVRGVSPIILPGYAEVISHCVKNGAEVDLIVTPEILKIISRDHGDLVNDLLKHNNFRLYEVRENVTAAFTVTDKLLDLGLYRLDGTYDLSCDLICIGESAVSWGVELFDHYRNKSTIVI